MIKAIISELRPIDQLPVRLLIKETCAFIAGATRRISEIDERAGPRSLSMSR
jgi:hypothetical protein